MTNNIRARGLSGFALSHLSIDQYNRNKLLHFGKLESFPTGTRHPVTFLMAQENGGMSSHAETSTLEDVSGNLAGGLNAVANINAALDVLNIVGQLIVQGFATINANGQFSFAPTLNGASYAQATLTAQLLASGNLGAIIDMVMTENISISENITVQANGDISAVIGGPNPLSPEGLAEAVWSKNLSSYMTDETAGKLIKEIKEQVKTKLDTGTFIALK